MFHAASESSFSVKGRVLSPSLPQTAVCTLELYRADKGRKVQQSAVTPSFDKVFVIEGGAHPYYMILRCPGAAPFNTKTYNLGRVREAMKPIELGDITLAPANR